MNSVVHKLHLLSDEQFGRRLPPLHVGRLLVEVPHAVRAAISMSLRNRSSFGDVIKDVCDQNADSQRFDPSLLRRITNFRTVFERSPFSGVDFTSRHYTEKSPAKVNAEVVASAKKLLGRTPAPQRIRLVGTLDGLEASTQRFSILLDTGEKITGVFPDHKGDVLQGLWRDRVLVLGTAVYCASGRLLRIGAEDVRPGHDEASIFSRLPIPPHERIDVARLHKEQGPRSGLAAIMGRWPDDEADELIEAALNQLS